VARISASEARFRDVAQAASDWMGEADAELQLTYLSDHFTQMTGLDRHGALGRPLSEILRMSGEDGRFAVDRREPFRDLVCRLDRPDGATRSLRVAATPMAGRQAEFQGYRGTATDITAETAAVAEAKYLAEHDSLKGLPNRLRQALAEAASRCAATAASRPCCASTSTGSRRSMTASGILWVTSFCGPAAGGSARPCDLVARLGRDEFAVLLSDFQEPADVVALCERVVETIALPFTLNGHDVIVTASEGAALFPVDATRPTA
jgi:PAS domain S-box-containing protein